MDVVRDAAERLGVILSEGHALAGSLSGSVVVAGHTDRHGDVVLKVSGHQSQDAASAARRELAAYTELAPATFLPELLSSAVMSDWTALVLRRYEPMPPVDRWAEEDWLTLTTVLVELHDRTPPADRELWEWPAWPGLDPVADRPALGRLWRTPETGRALDAVIACLPELVAVAGSLPTSFTHGDCHPANVLRGDSGPLLCDWQGARIASGSNDIAFLLTRAVPTAVKPPRAQILDRYCALRGLPRDGVAEAVRAEQILVLAFRYPAFADYLDATAVDRLGRAFTELVDGL